MVRRVPRDFVAAGFCEDTDLPSRRTFIRGLAAGGALAGFGTWDLAALAQGRSREPQQVLRGTSFDLSIGETPMDFTGSPRLAQTINGSMPAPVLRWREGDTVTAARRQSPARRGHVDPLARHAPAGEHGRRAGAEFRRHPARRDLHLSIRCASRPAPTGTTAIPASRNRRGLYGPLVIDPLERRSDRNRSRPRRAALGLDRLTIPSACSPS